MIITSPASNDKGGIIMSSVLDAAILTDEVRASMFEATERELDLDELVKCIGEALKGVEPSLPLINKLLHVASRSFMFGYFIALQDFQEIQAELMDAAAHGELEDNTASQGACDS